MVLLDTVRFCGAVGVFKLATAGPRGIASSEALTASLPSTDLCESPVVDCEAL
jgi:hypothetical protein